MPARVTGVVTSRDAFVTDHDKSKLTSRVLEFCDKSFLAGAFTAKYSLGENYAWKVDEQRAQMNDFDDELLTRYDYRPFDTRWIYYHDNLVFRTRRAVMRHYQNQENLGLVIGRQGQVVGGMQWNLVFAHNSISDFNLFYRGGGLSSPLYLYRVEQDLDQTRRVNIDQKLWQQLKARAARPRFGTPDEVQTFDYIYGVLHCPAYRDTYAEFLKIDFPRIPWPATPDEFWDISAKGSELRKLHLMDPATVGRAPYGFKGEGEGTVDKPRYEDGKVWINATQYFDAAPPVSWTFYIGGYQPAQKWLKDRKGRQLSFEDVKHYQSILKILSETDRIMQTITMELGN